MSQEAIMFFYHPKKGQRTTVPFHTKDLPVGTLHTILKQADLSADDLRK